MQLRNGSSCMHYRAMICCQGVMFYYPPYLVCVFLFRVLGSSLGSQVDSNKVMDVWSKII